MMTRRGAIGAGLATGAAMMTKPVFASSLFPVVETAQGKLRGLTTGGIATFRGIHYGAGTSGVRFPERTTILFGHVRISGKFCPT